ncbi:hypothetical protein ALC57_12947, partial [Trachymyrmex cornetzi]
RATASVDFIVGDLILRPLLEVPAVLLERTVPAILRYYSQVLTNAFNEGVSSFPPSRFLLLAEKIGPSQLEGRKESQYVVEKVIRTYVDDRISRLPREKPTG